MPAGALLTFHHATMGAGKSMHVLAAVHQMGRADLVPLLLVRGSRISGTVESRVGLTAPAVDIADDDTDVAALVSAAGHVDRVLVDEAQFLSAAQVDQLAVVADRGTPVDCFGLRTDFRGQLFPGAARLLELADDIVRTGVPVLCRCGAPAIHNARVASGAVVTDGPVVAVDDGTVTYMPLCRAHHRTRTIPQPDR